EFRADGGVEALRGGIPGPPEVIGKVAQTVNTFGYFRKNGHTTENLHENCSLKRVLCRDISSASGEDHPWRAHDASSYPLYPMPRTLPISQPIAPGKALAFMSFSTLFRKSRRCCC